MIASCVLSLRDPRWREFPTLCRPVRHPHDGLRVFLRGLRVALEVVGNVDTRFDEESLFAHEHRLAVDCSRHTAPGRGLEVLHIEKLFLVRGFHDRTCQRVLAALFKLRSDLQKTALVLV